MMIVYRDYVDNIFLFSTMIKALNWWINWNVIVCQLEGQLKYKGLSIGEAIKM